MFTTFTLPPQTFRQKFKQVLKWVFPLSLLWMGVTFVFNKLFGRAIGKQIIKPPYEICKERGTIVPELPSNTRLKDICAKAEELNQGKDWKYDINGLYENSRVHHAYLKTHDGAFIEHSCIGPKNLLDADGKIANPTNTKVVLFFPGRTRNHLHHLPIGLLESHDMKCVFASFTHRGQVDPRNITNKKQLSYYRKLLGLTEKGENQKYKVPSSQVLELLKKMRFKKIDKSEDLISDGMPLVAKYLQQGLRPSQITIDAYSMGGVGVKVADRYRKIFKRFQSKNWERDQALVKYGQALFGMKDLESLKNHIAVCTEEGFEFNVWVDRTFSSLTRAVMGRLRGALDLAKLPRLGKIIFFVLLPFCEALLGLCKWRLNIIDSYKKLNPRLREVVAIESPIDVNTNKLKYESDTMVHFKGASLFQKLSEIGDVKMWEKLYKWIWKLEKKDFFRPHSPEAAFARHHHLSAYGQSLEQAREQRLAYPHHTVDNVLNGPYAHPAPKQMLFLCRGFAKNTLYQSFKDFVGNCDRHRQDMCKESQQAATRNQLPIPRLI